MNGAEMAGALALGIGFGVLSYWVPMMGEILVVVAVLVILTMMTPDSFKSGHGWFSPFAALWRWVRREGEGAWLRRAPFIGIVGGALVRWAQNLAVAQGGA